VTALFKKLNLSTQSIVHVLNASSSFEPQLAAACTGDAILWMVYPKGTSKKYRCEFNRDSGWAVLAAAGFQPVRMVIKTMTRKKP
jgi:hypothetical protein